MEVSIRYVQLENAGFKPTLVLEGRKLAHCIINDELSVRVVDMELRDLGRTRPVLFRGQHYPVSRFIESIRRIGARKGITEGARDYLERAERASPDAEEGINPVSTPAIPQKPVFEPLHSIPEPLKRGTGGLGSICDALGIDPVVARRRLRAAGMHAPYADAEAIRRILA